MKNTRRVSSFLLSLLMLTASMAVGVGAKDIDGSTLENLFMPQAIKDVREWVDGTRATTDLDNLHGLTVNVIGDSYLGGQAVGITDGMSWDEADKQAKENFVWPALLAYKYGWDYTNCAQNGAPVSTGTEITYADNLVNLSKKMPDNHPDVVIFNGGRNDFNKNVHKGTVDSTDTTTYNGALNRVIDTLRQKYPNAVLIYTTVWNFKGENSLGLESGAYQMEALKVCQARDVFLFNAYNPTVSGVDMSDDNFRAQYCLSANDVSHLNIEGMKLVMPAYESFISETLATAAVEGNGNDLTGGNSTGNNSNTGGTTQPPASGEGNETTPDTGNETQDTEPTTDSTEGGENEGNSFSLAAILGTVSIGAVIAIAVVAVIAAAGVTALVIFLVKRKKK